MKEDTVSHPVQIEATYDVMECKPLVCLATNGKPVCGIGFLSHSSLEFDAMFWYICHSHSSGLSIPLPLASFSSHFIY